MKRTQMYTMIASVGLLSGAMIAAAQDAPPRPPADNPPRANPPVNNPPANNPPPRPRQPAPPSDKPAIGAHDGYMETPRYAQRLDGNVGQNTIQIYDDQDFAGQQAVLDHVNKSNQAGTLNEYPEKFDNSASSMRWNLDPGVLVILYDDASGKGQQLALWGKGQIPDLAKCDFNNQASRWGWFDVGGGAEPRSEGAMHMPYGTQALDAQIAEGSVEMFDDQNFTSDVQRITGLTGQKAGDWQILPNNTENSVSSARWSLPEGVVLILSAKDDGNKDIVLFGQAQIADLGKLDFDNRASRYAWAYIGAPTKDPKAIKPSQP